MNSPAHDPFDALAAAAVPIEPRPDFARQLRSRLIAELELTVQLPERKPPMPSSTTTTTAVRAHTVTPYLCAHDGAAALAFYAEAFGAVERMRVVGDDGRLGHAEFAIGDVTLYLSDEYSEYGVVSPRTLGGTAVTLHLDVADVDAVFARAVAAGATALGEPTDQPHGARHGTLTDPFGHRWMVSQQVEHVSVDDYADRSRGSGFTVSPGTAPTGAQGAIWASLVYADARAGIAFLTDVLGFEPQVVVPDERDPSVIRHSQLAWPEGGVVQASSAGFGSPYSDRPLGAQSLYVVTADPQAVWERCRAAGVEVIDEPRQPEYAPGTMVFGIRDAEGNVFSFGQYAGQP